MKRFLFFLPRFFLLLCRVLPAQAALSSPLTSRSKKESSHLILMDLFPLSCAVAFQSPICRSLHLPLAVAYKLECRLHQHLLMVSFCMNGVLYTHFLTAYNRFAYFNQTDFRSSGLQQQLATNNFKGTFCNYTLQHKSTHVSLSGCFTFPVCGGRKACSHFSFIAWTRRLTDLWFCS